MHDVLRFWLDRGIDGFRADVIHAIGKDPALPDDPPELAAHPPLVASTRTPAPTTLLRGIRAVLDGYDDRMMVGEVYLLGERITERTATYVGARPAPPVVRLHAAVRPLGRRRPLAPAHRPDRRRLPAPTTAWPTWVLSNHDNVRHRTRYGSEAAARAAAVLLLGVRGTPFLYAGEELGLEDADVPPDRVVDPGGRDGCRAPVPWTRPTPATAGAPSRGCRSRPTPAPARSRPSATTRRRCCGSTSGCSPPARRHRRCGGATCGSSTATTAVASWPGPAATATTVRAVVVDVGGDGGEVPAELAGWTVEVACDGPDGEGEPVGDDRCRPDRAVVLRPS